MATNKVVNLKVVSFNMHGFNQGAPVIEDLISSEKPDVFMLQEHWLTPDNLCRFERYNDYFCFGQSAMTACLQSGMLRGRPFGGVMCLIHKKLRKDTVLVHCDERYSVIKVFNYLFINVYFPCSGSDNRLTVCYDLIADISSWCDRYSLCNCVIAGDFNTSLDSRDAVGVCLSTFLHKYNLSRCDNLFPAEKRATYVNVSLGHESCIDYILSSCPNDVDNFRILDPDVNFSDHLPLVANFVLPAAVSGLSDNSGQSQSKGSLSAVQSQLRWDKADRGSYYSYTGVHLQSVVHLIDNALYEFESGLVTLYSSHDFIERIYMFVISILDSGSKLFVPVHRKGFFKFWWDEELSILKEASIEAEKLWKAAGKPRQGPIFSRRQSCRRQYKVRIKEKDKANTAAYTNDLHDALLKKNNDAFWQSWRSKFETRSKCDQVDGKVDPNIIAYNFASHFKEAFSCNNSRTADQRKEEYLTMRKEYCGLPSIDISSFDTELVSNVITGLKHGKAAGIDGLSAEHLFYCHPCLSVILSKLFQLMLLSNYVPNGFRYNYIVPIPKPKEIYSKSLTCNDFRGIAISPVISKVFEHCITKRYECFLTTADNQFGFKKGISCSHGIRAVRNIVDKYINGGNTANICALDLSKAFDKVNHHALFIKLMKRKIPVQLLCILEFWLTACFSCVKWKDVWSEYFCVQFGVRQGSVLSPILFAIYVDDLAKSSFLKFNSYIVLYADDILLLTPSVCELENLLRLCEQELHYLDMAINVKKSCCLRIGPRNNTNCAPIATLNGTSIPWVSEVRYLGIYIVRSQVFKCSLEHARKAFYRSANSILGKLGRIASEEVVLQLITSKCIPVLLYGLEACPLSKSDLSSIDFVINRFFMKLLRTNNIENVRICQSYFNFVLPSTIWATRVAKFDKKFMSSDNAFCCLTLQPITVSRS